MGSFAGKMRGKFSEKIPLALFAGELRDNFFKVPTIVVALWRNMSLALKENGT